MPTPLRSLWNRPPAADPPARVWRDWALLGVFVVAAVLEASLRTDLAWPVASAVVTLAAGSTLLWRRTRPLQTVLIAFLGIGVFDLIGLIAGTGARELYSAAVLLILPYALFRWGSGRDLLIGSAVILASGALATATGGAGIRDWIAGPAVLVSVTASGALVRARADARALRLEQQRRRERDGIARELHDTVAHHVSAIVVRAQAGRVVSETDPAAAAAALRVIEDEAALAMAEMRSMVRMLREPAERAPAAGLAALEDLAVSDAVPAVTVWIDPGLAEPPAELSAALRRIAQESVTNARRHAVRATRIGVRLDIDAATLRLRVDDDGGPPAAPGSGYGILGMTERAQLLGGTLTAGPGAHGWSVVAEFPYAGAAR